MPRRRITREKLTGGLLVAAAIAVMNVTTYGLTLAAARLLGPDQFGQFSSLLGVLIVVNVVSLALQATGARRVATSEQSRPELEHRILSATRMAAAAVLVIGLLLAPVLNRVLRLDSIWGAIAMAVAANVSLGLMLGLLPPVLAFMGLPLEARHVTLSTGQLAAAVGTLGWGVLLTSAFWWCVAGIAVTGALNLGVSFWLALKLALRSRGIAPTDQRSLRLAVWRRFKAQPLASLVPR